MVPLEQTNFALGWSASEKTYIATHPEAGSGRLEYALAGNNLAFVLARNQARLALGYTLQPSGPASGIGTVYRNEGAPAEWRRASFAFGLATPASAIPVSGQKRFGGPVALDSGVDLTINFAAGTVSGSLYAAHSDAWGPYKPVKYDLAAIPFDRSTGRFQTTIASPHPPLSIDLAGRLVGSSAEEIIVRFDAPVLDPYENTWVRFPFAGRYGGS